MRTQLRESIDPRADRQEIFAYLLKGSYAVPPVAPYPKSGMKWCFWGTKPLDTGLLVGYRGSIHRAAAHPKHWHEYCLYNIELTNYH